MGEYYIGEYRGCEIWMLTPPDYPKDVYHSPCVAGFYVKKSALKRRICEKQGGVWVDGKCTEAPPPEPPPDPEPHRVETYRGVDIWWGIIENKYTATVAGTYFVEELTLQACRDEIDRLLDWLEPPPDPFEGLFAQVVAAVKAWVLKNMPDWVLEWGKVINNFITNVTEEITNVYNYVTEEITNVINNTYETINNVFNTFKEYVTNVYNYVTEEITNIYNNSYEYITNIIGVSQEILDNALAGERTWVRDFFKLMDPIGFLKDPLGTIKAAFNIQRKIAEEAVVKSFWEGFEEGLREEGN